MSRVGSPYRATKRSKGLVENELKESRREGFAGVGQLEAQVNHIVQASVDDPVPSWDTGWGLL